LKKERHKKKKLSRKQNRTKKTAVCIKKFEWMNYVRVNLLDVVKYRFVKIDRKLRRVRLYSKQFDMYSKYVYYRQPQDTIDITINQFLEYFRKI
jgi:hypothetical protein